MRTVLLFMSIAAALTQIAAAGPTTAPAPPTRPALLTIAHAGLAVRVPADLRLRRPAGEAEVLSGEISALDGRPLIACTITAEAVQPDASLADYIALVRRSSLAVKKQKTVAEEKLRVAGRPAVRQRIRYTYRGDERVAEMVFILAPAGEGEKFALAYVLTLEGRPAAGARLDAVRKGLLESWRFVPLVHPAAQPIRMAEVPTPAPQAGFAVAAPRGWNVQTGPLGLKTFQTDYLAGGVADPTASVIGSKAADGESADHLADEAVKGAKELFADGKLEILSRAPASLGHLDGREVVMRVRFPGAAWVCAQRYAVFEGKAYTLSVTFRSDRAADVRRLAEAMARSFTLPAPTTRSTPNIQ